MKRTILAFTLFLLSVSAGRTQDYFLVTADTLIYYYTESYEVWEEAMGANGLKLMKETQDTPRDMGRIYAVGPMLRYQGDCIGISQALSKTDQLVSVHFFNYKNDNLYLGYLFDEIISKSQYVGKYEAFSYYLYREHLFGLQYGGSGKEEGVLVIKAEGFGP